MEENANRTAKDLAALSAREVAESPGTARTSSIRPTKGKATIFEFFPQLAVELQV